MPKDLLANSKSLSLLNLQHNELTNDVIEVVSTSQSLLTLILDYNQLTAFVAPKSFPALQSLHVGSNQIKYISTPILPNCSSLTSLDLSNNSIIEFNSQTLQGCILLQKLYLQHNKLTGLSNSFATKLSSIKNLYLHGNNISFLPMNVLQSMSDLALLQVDPFPCTCELHSLAVWAHRNKVKGLRCWVTGMGVAKITSLLRTCSIKEANSRTNTNDRILHYSVPLNNDGQDKDGQQLESPIVDANSGQSGFSSFSGTTGFKSSRKTDFLSELFQTTIQQKGHDRTIVANTSKEQCSCDGLVQEVKVLNEAVSSLKNEVDTLKAKLTLLDDFIGQLFPLPPHKTVANDKDEL